MANRAKGFVAWALVAVFTVTLAFAAAGEQVLVLSAKDLENYNPFQLLGRNDDVHVATQIWDTLVFSSRGDFTAQREIAINWSTPDPYTWVIDLRPGVMFQDGNEVFAEGQSRELVAADVIASVNYAMKYASNLNLGSIVSLEALDDYTVKVTTDSPQPLLLTSIHRLGDVLIVPPEAVTETDNGIEVLPVGSGPFELQSFVPSEEAIMTRNEDYWLPVILDEVQFVVIPDAAASVIALEAGQIDVLAYGPADEGPRLIEEGFVLSKRGGSYRGVGLNVSKAPFDNILVREGISMILDIDSAWKAVIPEGFGERAYGQVPPWVPMGYDPEGLMDLDSFDVAGGVAKLNEAGWTDSNSDGWLDKDGEKFAIELKCFSGAQVRVMTILATQLQQVGVEATVLQQDVGVWVDDLLGGNTTAFFDFSYAGDTGLYSMFHGGAIGNSNTHYYSNPEVDRLLDLALETIDFAERSALWKAAQRIIVQERAIIPMYFEWTTTYVAPYVKGWVSAWGGGLQLVSVENSVYLDN
jgi:peptide/nickel transport system substrate-binding protein